MGAASLTFILMISNKPGAWCFNFETSFPIFIASVGVQLITVLEIARWAFVTPPALSVNPEFCGVLLWQAVLLFVRIHCISLGWDLISLPCWHWAWPCDLTIKCEWRWCYWEMNLCNMPLKCWNHLLWQHSLTYSDQAICKQTKNTNSDSTTDCNHLLPIFSLIVM